jgi:hypothetical protein
MHGSVGLEGQLGQAVQDNFVQQPDCQLAWAELNGPLQWLVA